MMASIQSFTCGPSSVVWFRKDAIVINRGRNDEGIGASTVSPYGALLGFRVTSLFVANSVSKPCEVIL